MKVAFTKTTSVLVPENNFCQTEDSQFRRWVKSPKATVDDDDDDNVDSLSGEVSANLWYSLVTPVNLKIFALYSDISLENGGI